MKLPLPVFIFAMLVVLFSCSGEFGHKKNKIDFKLGSKTDFNEKAGVQVYLDSTDKVLHILLETKKAGELVFPLDEKTKDTLCFAAYCVEFFYQGKPLLLNEASRTMFSQRSMPFTLCDSLYLKLKTDTISLKTNRSFQLDIPFLAFSSIPAGNNKALQIKWSQDYLYSEKREKKVFNRYLDSMIKVGGGNASMLDSITIFERKAKKQSLADMVIDCTIDMPGVHKSSFTCRSIQLQNDSSWNPAGSDVTLFKSSYPDLYYEFSFPAGFVQHQSAIATSSESWDIGDTSILYFYDHENELNFFLMDYDKLSRDDVVESRLLTLKNLRDAGLRGGIHFGHVYSLQGKLGVSEKVN